MSFGFSLMVSAVKKLFFVFFIVENCVYDFDFTVNHILIFLKIVLSLPHLNGSNSEFKLNMLY